MEQIRTGGMCPPKLQSKLSPEQGIAADIAFGIVAGAASTGIYALAAYIIGYNVPLFAATSAVSFSAYVIVKTATNYFEKKDVIYEGTARSIDVTFVAIAICAISAGFFALNVTGPVAFGLSCAFGAIVLGVAAYTIYTAVKTGHSPAYNQQKAFADRAAADAHAATISAADALTVSLP
jgi:hypothetical protein